MATPELAGEYRRLLIAAIRSDGLELAEPDGFRLATHGQLYPEASAQRAHAQGEAPGGVTTDDERAVPCGTWTTLKDALTCDTAVCVPGSRRPGPPIPRFLRLGYQSLPSPLHRRQRLPRARHRRLVRPNSFAIPATARAAPRPPRGPRGALSQPPPVAPSRCPRRKRSTSRCLASTSPGAAPPSAPPRPPASAPGAARTARARARARRRTRTRPPAHRDRRSSNDRVLEGCRRRRRRVDVGLYRRLQLVV